MAVFHKQYRLKGNLVTIRSAEPEDAAELIALVKTLDQETDFLARDPGEFSMTEAEERRFIQARKAADHFRFAVAVVDGKIVGTCDAFYHTQNRYRHTGEVAIALRKAYWNMGIGRAMLEEGLNWLKEKEVETVSLTVDTQNHRAISLYQRLGFVVTGTVPRERKLQDGTYHDAYHMTLQFHQ